MMGLSQYQILSHDYCGQRLQDNNIIAIYVDFLQKKVKNEISQIYLQCVLLRKMKFSSFRRYHIFYDPLFKDVMIQSWTHSWARKGWQSLKQYRIKEQFTQK